MKNYDSLRLLTLKEGEVYDNKTGHKLTEIDGEIVEMKLCTHCHKWHPLNKFGLCSSSKDKLQSWCRDCQHSRAPKDEQKNNDPIDIVNQDFDNEISMEPISEEQLLTNMICSIYAKNNTLEAENEQLKSELDESKKKEINLSNLNEREIQTVLSTNKIAPKLLFEAIQKIDSRYQFYCIDNFTGLTTEIKTEYSA